MKNMNLRGSYLLSKNEVLIDYVKTRLRLLFITSWEKFYLNLGVSATFHVEFITINTIHFFKWTMFNDAC